MNKNYRIPMENDMFCIVHRLRQIDKDYFVLYNLKTKKFEIHNASLKNNTLCLTLPFNNLDNRAIDYVHRTHVRNYDKIIYEIESNNLKLEEKNNDDLNDKINYRFNDIYKYATASNSQFNALDAYNNFWI